jgi:hypothetical protein
MDRVSPSRGFVEPEMELLLLFDGISGIDSKGWKFEAAELVELRGQCQLKVEPMREPSEVVHAENVLLSGSLCGWGKLKLISGIPVTSWALLLSFPLCNDLYNLWPMN